MLVTWICSQLIVERELWLSCSLRFQMPGIACPSSRIRNPFLSGQLRVGQSWNSPLSKFVQFHTVPGILKPELQILEEAISIFW